MPIKFPLRVALEQVLWWAKNRLNDEVEEREEKKGREWDVSL